MKKFKYIVVDDDFPSHLTVQSHFKSYPRFTCLAAFSDPKKAITFIQEHDVDLIFLDIKMPEMTGFQFLEDLHKPVFTVMLTAYYEEYALSAHPYYMDKKLLFFANKAQLPYYFPKIIAHFEKLFEEKEILDRVHQLSKNEFLTFPKKFKKKSILLADILTITVGGHNSAIKMKNGEEPVFRMTLREMISFLPESSFLHIRRDVIINIMHVTAFTDTTVCVGDRHFQISIRKQNQIIEKLKAQKLELYKDYGLK